MHLVPRILCCGLLVLLLAGPAAAAQILTGTSLAPVPPLVPGGQQQLVAAYAIVSGTTFPKDHEIQMQTGLADARWTLQVILDGNNAARQTAAGNAAFLNGPLLAYPVNRDVSFTVTVSGIVPPGASGQLTLLQLEEIDNTGNIVPGSLSTVSEPVEGIGTSGVQSLVQTPSTMTSPPPPRSPAPALPAPTRSPGFSAAAALPALVAAGLVLLRSRKARE